MTEILHREFVYLWYYFTVQFEQIFLYWVFGIVIGSVISVFGKESIHKLFARLQGKRLGVFGAIFASTLGIASPLSCYGTIPICAAFSEKGIKDDWLAAFMMGSILLNPQLILYSAALGVPALTIRLVSCLLGGILAGVLVRIFFLSRNRAFFRFDHFREAPVNRDTHPQPLLRLFHNILRNLKATGLYFLFGIILSAIFQRYVPSDVMVTLFGKNKAWGVLMAATIGVPLYACGGGTIPLLQGWLLNGMSMGSAAAFMLTGPATKITNLSAMKIVLGMKHFVLYLGFCMVFALCIGVIVNGVL
ncbi:permease [Clostridia bacterium]|nr:permease [Clostridia bacterium]